MKKVYTYGVFDLLHPGHLALLEEAKSLGDCLIVGVLSDAAAESFKRRPIMDERERMRMVGALKCVDKVVMQGEYKPGKNIERYRPAILAKGPGAGWETKVPKFRKVQSVLLNYHEGVSTSQIIERCKTL